MRYTGYDDDDVVCGVRTIIGDLVHEVTGTSLKQLIVLASLVRQGSSASLTLVREG